jgi:hypothetical protein
MCLAQVFTASSFEDTIPYQPVISVRGWDGIPPLNSAVRPFCIGVSIQVSRCGFPKKKLEGILDPPLQCSGKKNYTA